MHCHVLYRLDTWDINLLLAFRQQERNNQLVLEEQQTVHEGRVYIEHAISYNANRQSIN